MSRSQVLASVILALLLVAGGPVRAQKLAMSDAECLQAQESCEKRCPASPKQRHDDCKKVCDARALSCYMGVK
jgi:hypothetical protein